MAEKIIVKKVVVGTPIKRVTAGSFAITNLGGVDVTASESDGSILAYNELSGKYEVTNLRTDANITAEFDSEQNKYTFGLTNTSFTGSIIPDSNEAYDLGSSSNKWRDLYLSGDTITLGSISLKDSGGQLVFVDSDGNKTGLGLSLVTNNVSILSLDSDTGVFTFNDSDIARTDVNEVFHAGLTVNGGATIDSATITNLANTNLTGSQATLDSANIGELRVTGNTVLDGNLTITGTETILNTETINLADNTIVLNSNATGTPTENAGIEVERGDETNVTLLWDEGNGYWTLDDKTLATTGKMLFGNVYSSEGDLPSASQYHGMFAHVHATGRGYFAHAGDWHRLIDSDTTARQQIYTLSSEVADITDGTITTLYNQNLIGGQATFDSASITTITNTNLTGSQATFDSATVTTLTNTTLVGGQATFDSATATNLATTQLTGSQATFDSATITNIRFDNIDAQTTATIRNIFSASGDLSYDSATGQFSFDVETVYTKANFDSDLGDANTGQLPEGTNLYYTTARADSDFDVRLATKTTDDVTEGTSLYYTTARFDAALATKTTADLAEHNSNLYYTTARADSDAKNSVSVTDAGGDGSLSYNASTGVFTYTGPSAAEVRSHFSAGGDITYDSATGRFSIDVEDIYTQANFDSDFLKRLESQIDSAGITTLTNTNATITNLTGSQATFDSANIITLGAVANIDATTTSTIRGLFTAAGDLTYNNSTGEFTFDVEEVYTKANFDSDLGDANTGQLPEGSNLYYTDARVQTKLGSVSGSIIPDTDSAYDLGSATNKFKDLYLSGQTLYLGDLVLKDSGGVFSVQDSTGTSLSLDISNLSTSDLSEGSNLYYTDTRVRNAIGLQDQGGDGSLTYDSATGRFSYTGPSAAEVRAHLTANKGLSVTSGEFNIDSANVKGMFSATDAGGDGSFSYSDGVFTYTGPSASEARAHFSGGTGVTITDGSIAIGQSVGTTDNVTFAQTTMDSAIVDGVNFNVLTSRHANAAGTLYFDSDHQKGLSLVLDTQNNPNPDVTLNVGQEIFLYVHNLTGAQINNGDAVYISGTAHGKHPQVSLARANTSSTGQATGLATMDIPDGAHGWVTRYGLVRDVNTSGMTAGSILFLSPDSAGVVTETPVTVDTGYPFHIGRVLTVDATNGVILVDPQSEHFDDLRVENKLKTSQIVADSASLLHVQFDTSTFDSHQPYSEGLLYYDNKHKTLNYNDDITGMVHEVGTQEHQRVFNNTGALIRKGSALYFSGNYTSGTIDVPTVGLADATDVNAYNAQGIAALDIPNNSYGHCLIAGQLTEVNTAHLSDGTNFFVSVTTPGSHQNASPTYPNFPMCLGWVVKNGDSDNGILLVNQQNHSVRSFRVQTSAHIGTDLQVDGNLTILGSQTTVGTSNVTQGSPIYRLNEGDAIGEAGTVFTGTGLDDAFFAGHFTGTTTQTYYVRIDGVLTGPSGVDTFEVALGTDSNFVSPILTKQPITGNPQLIHSADNISVEFGATTGHDSGDRWSGTASPVNVDTGFFTNRNTGTSGVGYTHMGLWFDVTDEKWKIIDEYDSTPTGTINAADSSFSLATLVADTFEGSLIGAVTGNAQTASALASGQNFSLTGDITASAVSFDGTGAVQLTTAYNPGSIVNADINASAAIADSKLATISTAGKVNNSATTATAANTGSAIIARDASGNFAGGTFTGEVNRDAQTTVTAGTYGSATAIPVLTIDANGFVDSAGTIGVSGITGVDFDSSNGTLTIATSGDDFTDVITLDPFTTADLTENTNLYYTDARARASVSVTDAGGDGSLAYNSGTGVLTYTGPSAAEVRAHLTANKGLSVTSGEFNIDSANVRGMFSGGTGITYNSGTGAISTTDGDIVHDNLSGFVANEHIDHTSVSVIAGNGLTGGGTIAANRTLNVVGGNGINVNADNIEIDSADIRNIFSASGSLSYNSSTGAFSYTDSDRTPAQIRGLFASGTNTTYNSATGATSISDATIRGKISATGDITYNSGTGEISFSETYSTANELLTAVKTVDGASSGLDADLLDGQEGSHYRINVYNNAGTLLN